ncbi:MAG: transcription antitermination factor NusB [Rhodobiaceae bacterium]|nr:transcription antitermination factor NusB [Rhodobiaceae bacterium]MCC0041609.1 transcription antitermination factor NusB [Rhodobiaceae bacterium]
MTREASPPKDKPRKGASRAGNKRTAARLGAVQALYQMDIAGGDLPSTLAEFEAHRLGRELDGEQYGDADAAFFRDLVTGVVREQLRIDRLVDRVLQTSWPLKRIDLTLRNILRAGSYELLYRKDVPARAAITEYVDVAHGFYEDDGPRLVNGVLDSIAREERADEVSAKRAGT